MKNNLVKSSWKNLESHYLNVLSDPWYKCIAELQNLINVHTTKFYLEREIKTLHLPITTGSISSPMGLGSDSLPVMVNLFGVDTFLADSMQFMLEYGCRIFEKGCYYIMPSFRGEDADERHLCQFYHSEAEIPGKLDDVIKLVEDYIIYLCKAIIGEYGDELSKFNRGNDHIIKIIDKKSFPRISFDEAAKLLKNSSEYISESPEGFRSISREGEKKLISLFDGIVWLTHFDYLSVPFYQATSKEDSSKAINADLLFGIGEVVGSGERHEYGLEVINALNRHNVQTDEYEWYINMKDKFPMKTSGFGLGLERFILWLTNHNDIRDCQILPRFNGVNIIP